MTTVRPASGSAGIVDAAEAMGAGEADGEPVGDAVLRGGAIVTARMLRCDETGGRPKRLSRAGAGNELFTLEMVEVI